MVQNHAESWILNATLLKKLESFQAEIGKRILRLPKSTSNNITRLALQWPSIRARALCIKVGFLLKIVKGNDTLSSRVFRSLAVDDVEALHLVKQCRFLESFSGFNITSRVLSSPNEVSFAEIKKEILDTHFKMLQSVSATHPSQRMVQKIATSPNSSWPKVWDHALDKGAFGTSCSLALLRLILVFMCTPTTSAPSKAVKKPLGRMQLALIFKRTHILRHHHRAMY